MRSYGLANSYGLSNCCHCFNVRPHLQLLSYSLDFPFKDFFVAFSENAILQMYIINLLLDVLLVIRPKGGRQTMTMDVFSVLFSVTFVAKLTKAEIKDYE